MILTFRKGFFAALGIIYMILWAQAGNAQLLSVDNTGAPRSATTAPGFANYFYTYNPDSGLPTAANIGSVIGCKLAQVNPAGSSTVFLKGDYSNKDGNTSSTDPNAGWRLSMDGCRVWWKDDVIPTDRPWTNNGSFGLTISNLSVGFHPITTYQNDIWGKSPPPAWHGANKMSKCIISANGVPVFTNPPTFYATNDSKFGFAYFYNQQQLRWSAVGFAFQSRPPAVRSA